MNTKQSVRQAKGEVRDGNPPSSGETAKRAGLIAGVLLAAAVGIALLVALSSGGGDSAESPEAVSASEAARIPSGELRQVGPASVSATLPRLTDAGVDPAVGMEAPTIDATYFTTEEVTIAVDDGAGRVYLFLAHWCPHCQDEVRDLVPWFEANGVPTDVDIVAISTSVDSGAPNYPPSDWLRREGWPVPVLRDSSDNQIAAAFGLSGFPFIVVVNDDGEIVSRSSGGVTTEEWESTLESATNG